MRARSSLRAECLPVRISASNRSRSSALRVTTYLLTAACLADTEPTLPLTRAPSIRRNQALSMTRGTRLRGQSGGGIPRRTGVGVEADFLLEVSGGLSEEEWAYLDSALTEIS